MPDVSMPGSRPAAQTDSADQASAEFRIVLTTCATLAEAERIAHSLVESRLAACVNLIPAAASIYRWQEQIESSPEILLLIKTSNRLLPQVEEAIASLHSYAVPEFLVLGVAAGSSSYLEWLAASLK